jgi:hypothetical protein
MCHQVHSRLKSVSKALRRRLQQEELALIPGLHSATEKQAQLRTSDGSLQALKLARPEDSSQGSQHPTFTHPTRTTRELAVHHREGLRTVSGLQLDDFLDHKRGCGP